SEFAPANLSYLTGQPAAETRSETRGQGLGRPFPRIWGLAQTESHSEVARCGGRCAPPELHRVIHCPAVSPIGRCARQSPAHRIGRLAKKREKTIDVGPTIQPECRASRRTSSAFVRREQSR